MTDEDAPRPTDERRTPLDELEMKVRDIEATLDGLEGMLHQLTLTAPTPPGAPDAAPADGDNAHVDTSLDMRTLVAWVRNNIALLIERKMPQSGGWPHWCPMWWQHPEAIARLEALRRAWLEAAATATGTALIVYFEHVDLQLATLCGDNGPFSGCLGGHNPDSPARFLGQVDPDDLYYREVDAATSPTRDGQPDFRSDTPLLSHAAGWRRLAARYV